ncbi:coproporphyrinogen III oxidase [Roseovarius atlanticus]|uniref:Coproporphyrinogen-III oxidase n=1 Tax=Roseovarius atlanticus TaxID=1641875 RepID=A0A0T5NYM0_9RHOB|nr:oxygen-independent coproporphyrinogen III oxidase [Roseovarius atlanticus]KRS13932.1 coproporphyrinogen III oxidase [Roseovarius atlanticus]
MIDREQLRRLGLFDANVPRYTSYPTAPHFSESVGPSTMRNWISNIAPGSAISLYLHVPFCRRLCWFCACRTQGTKSLSPVAAYVEMLKAELALLKSTLPDGVTLSRLHWGGGTPTLLSADLITDLANAVRDAVPFGDDTEFSVEIDPNEIDAPRIEALAAAGMNRASVGVQDFDDVIQQAIGRIQTFDITRDTIDALRAAGVRSLNADILYGLPHQTKARMVESVQKLLSLTPDRVALYGYAHVPWMAKRQQLIPSDALPTPEERLELFESARRLFVWDGYKEIGIDHFATPEDGLSIAKRLGRLRRNFQGYTDDTSEVLVGLGASSISRFPQGYAQNAPATGAHTGAIREGRFSTSRGHVFKGQDLLRSRLIEAVMCDFRIDAGEICETFSMSRLAVRQMLEPTARAFEGLLDLSNEGLFIPPAARPLTRMIARSLDTYDLSRAGHSPAI